MTVTKDNCGSIRLSYADIADIPDIRDIDGNGSAFYSFAYITDIYGDQINVSDKTDHPDRELFDILDATEIQRWLAEYSCPYGIGEPI